MKKIHQMVEHVKQSEEVSLEYMKIFEREEMLKELGREEGKTIGKNEGIAIGKIEGIAVGKAEDILELLEGKDQLSSLLLK